MMAHWKYMFPRIHEAKKKQEFMDTMQIMVRNVLDAEPNTFNNIPKNVHGGVNMAVDVAMEILAYDEQRFGHEGRSGDFYMEKL
jgi:hypothetical protein